MRIDKASKYVYAMHNSKQQFWIINQLNVLCEQWLCIRRPIIWTQLSRLNAVVNNVWCDIVVWLV